MSKEQSDSTTSVHRVVHTPGPWEVKGPSQNGHCRRIFAGDDYVAIVGGLEQPMKTIRANADLIAAAPDMLDACWATIQYLNTRADPESNDLWGKVSAAYRRACGIED